MADRLYERSSWKAEAGLFDASIAILALYTIYETCSRRSDTVLRFSALGFVGWLRIGVSLTLVAAPVAGGAMDARHGWSLHVLDRIVQAVCFLVMLWSAIVMARRQMSWRRGLVALWTLTIVLGLPRLVAASEGGHSTEQYTMLAVFAASIVSMALNAVPESSSVAIVGLYGLRFATTTCRIIGLLLVAMRVDGVLDVKTWRWSQVFLPLWCSDVLCTAGAIVWLMSVSRAADAADTQRLFHVAFSLVLQAASFSGIGGGVFKLLLSQHFDGVRSYKPWQIALPLILQVIAFAVVWFIVDCSSKTVSKQGGALKLGMALTSAAGSMAAAVLPVLLFLRVTHRVTMSYFVVFGVLWIAILGAAALGFQSSRRFKPRRENWTTLRMDLVCAIGYVAWTILLALEANVGHRFTTQIHHNPAVTAHHTMLTLLVPAYVGEGFIFLHDIVFFLVRLCRDGSGKSRDGVSDPSAERLLPVATSPAYSTFTSTAVAPFDSQSVQRAAAVTTSLMSRSREQQSRMDNLKRRVHSAKSKPLCEWTVLELEAWVEVGLGLPQYAPMILTATQGALSSDSGPGGHLAAMDERTLAAALHIDNAVHLQRLYRALHRIPLTRAQLTESRRASVDDGGRGPSPATAADAAGSRAAATSPSLQLQSMDSRSPSSSAMETATTAPASTTAAAAVVVAVASEAPVSGDASATVMVPYDVEADPNVAWVAEVWLTDIGLPQYADVFKANLVSTATLRGLVESSVRDALRITDPLHIRSLLTAVSFLEKYDFDSGGEITKLRSVFSEVLPGLPEELLSWTNAHVVTWLCAVLDLEEPRHAPYIQRLRTSGLHGALLFWEVPFSSDHIATAFAMRDAGKRATLAERLAPSLRELEDIRMNAMLAPFGPGPTVRDDSPVTVPASSVAVGPTRAGMGVRLPSAGEAGDAYFSPQPAVNRSNMGVRLPSVDDAGDVFLSPLPPLPPLPGASASATRPSNCVICKDAVASVRCLPCGHTVTCRVCYVSSDVHLCPACRRHIVDTEDVE